LHYVEGLALDAITLRLDSSPSTTVEVHGVADWALLVARGVDLAGGTGELRRWHEGQSWDDARAMITGRLLAPTYGDVDEPLVATLTQRRAEARLFPPATAAIDAGSWPVTAGRNIDEGLFGATYPVIFGYPGLDTDNGTAAGTSTRGAVPAYLTEWTASLAWRSSILVVAYGAIEATQLRIVHVSGGLDPQAADAARSWVVPLVRTVDRRGVLVTAVDLDDGASPARFTPRAGDEYWTAFTQGGGGIFSREHDGAMRAAGEIAQWMLEQVGVAVDTGRLAVARARLDRYLLDFALLEPTNPETWLVDELGELLPLVVRDGTDGMWIDLVNYEATPRDVERELVLDAFPAAAGDGITVERTSPISLPEPTDLVNEITVAYGPREGNALVKRITLTGDPESVDLDQGILPSAWCEVSRQRYGVRAQEFEVWVVHDDATALRLAQSFARHRSLPRRSFSVAGNLELEVLEPGSIVSVTGSREHLDAELAVVVEVGLGLERIDLQLELLEDPTIRRRSTT
jgi:hypothetical protein